IQQSEPGVYQMSVCQIESQIRRYEHNTSVPTAGKQHSIDILSQCHRVFKLSLGPAGMLHRPTLVGPKEIGAPCNERAIELTPLGRKLGRYGLELAARLRRSWLVIVPRPDAETLGGLKRIIHVKVR